MNTEPKRENLKLNPRNAKDENEILLIARIRRCLVESWRNDGHPADREALLKEGFNAYTARVLAVEEPQREDRQLRAREPHQQAYQKQWREQRKLVGICSTCRGSCETGRTLCKPCRQKKNGATSAKKRRFGVAAG